MPRFNRLVDLSVCLINYEHKSHVSKAAAIKVPVVSNNGNLIITAQNDASKFKAKVGQGPFPVSRSRCPCA